MEEPYRVDPAPRRSPRASPWWRERGWPSHEETRDGLGYIAAIVLLGLMVGPMAGVILARVLGRVDRDGYRADFFLGGLFGGLALGLVVGVISAVWGTSRLRWVVVLGYLLAGALLAGGQVVFPPHR